MVRTHALTSFAAALVTTVLAASGCSDPEPATSRVTLETELRVGGNGTTACPMTGPLFTIGEFGNPGLTPPEPVKPVENGGADQQGTATVVCSVVANGAGGFDVRASAQLSGATGGLFRIEGNFKAEGAQSGIRVTISKQPFGVFEASDCTVTYATEFQGVAAGRVWGQLDCPSANRQDTGASCQALAQFRFENCSQ